MGGERFKNKRLITAAMGRYEMLLFRLAAFASAVLDRRKYSALSVYPTP